MGVGREGGGGVVEHGGRLRREEEKGGARKFGWVGGGKIGQNGKKKEDGKKIRMRGYKA